MGKTPEALAAEQSTAPMTDTADWPVSLPPGEIGTREPTWVADDAYSNCMSCGAKFTVWRRRHHCRTCGRLLCSQCTPARLRLAFATTASAESGETAASETTTTEGGDSAAAAAAATTAPQLRSPAQPHGRPNPSLEQRLMKLISGQAGRLHRVCTDCFEVLSVRKSSGFYQPECLLLPVCSPTRCYDFATRALSGLLLLASNCSQWTNWLPALASVFFSPSYL
ncbi:unnamed protein product [Schistocephalus solidus]|uniref:FYVE-type domain-containing protein n=1 Tax=Schistocephalus solidus TaxID=70667 RepID=A0A183T9B7_SCHSO|nr:unnamed protein product [Schistocephalus solidus]